MSATAFVSIQKAERKIRTIEQMQSPLPVEVLDQIYSFTFHDIQIYYTHIFEHSIQLIQNAFFISGSSARHIHIRIFFLVTPNDKLQLQSCICTQCGNYRYKSKPRDKKMSIARICCYCVY